MYSWVVKRSLYPPPISTENEILRIGNPKIIGLIPPRLWPMLVWGGIQGAFFQSVAMVAISRLPIAPAGKVPPRSPSPTLLDN